MTRALLFFFCVSVAAQQPFRRVLHGKTTDIADKVATRVGDAAKATAEGAVHAGVFIGETAHDMMKHRANSSSSSSSNT